MVKRFYCSCIGPEFVSQHHHGCYLQFQREVDLMLWPPWMITHSFLKLGKNFEGNVKNVERHSFQSDAGINACLYLKKTKNLNSYLTIKTDSESVITLIINLKTTGQRPIEQTRLAGQQAPGILLSLTPEHWN